jgi:hypothetical protein
MSERMTKENEPLKAGVDKIRASLDGHFYHHTWAARVALELLPPTSTLRILTIEDFSIEDDSSVSGAASEIADLVRYRGGVSIETASSVEVLQFKYSIARADQDVRAFDIKKTLEKFASTDADFIKHIGNDGVESVVRYEIVTNRPFSSALITAINALSQGETLDGDAADQAKYIKEALPALAGTLPAFLKRITLSGSQGTLATAEALVRRTLADWAAPNDPQTKIRLDNLRNLVRDKAGSKGQGNNEIDRVALLACLGVDDERDLFPTPDAFPTIPAIVERPVIATLLAEINKPGFPLLIDASGGMGKTVLMQSLAQRLAPANAVVLFDCFGGGNWRNPADGRHLPEKALPHIVNLLAAKGLCDILIPGANGVDLVRAFCRRLEHAVRALRHSAEDGRIVLLLDAIDNAAQQANATRTDSFARVLLQTLSLSPIEGVVAVASCRTERRDIARGTANCRRFEIPRFSEDEISDIARAHQNDVTATEIADLNARCEGNPRVLAALLAAGRPYHSQGSDSAKKTSEPLLDTLIWDRFQKALNDAVARGSSEIELHRMLAALATLPPPVPVPELAAAQGLTEAAVRSFAADLSPLLAYSQHELIFADEPTESLIQEKVKADAASREAVVQRLAARQEESNYAARALPSVLSSLGRTDDLVRLAFQDRLPRSATSKVAQRAIRLSRLSAALISCAKEQRTDDLTSLLVEASRVAGGNERSDIFLQDHPDLVAIADDTEAFRRLLEIRTSWPGRRHGSLSVAFALSDEIDEARRNAWRAFDWLNWRATQTEEPGDRKLPAVGDLDRFGPAYWAILGGKASRVISWIHQWREDYAFNLLSEIVSLLERHATISPKAKEARDILIRQACYCRVKTRPLFAALLSHASLDEDQTTRLITRLARISVASTPVSQVWSINRYRFILTDALLAAAIKAVRLSMNTEARSIVDGIGLNRPRISEFDSDVWVSETIQPFLLAHCIKAAIDGRSPILMDICPEELDAKIQKPTARKNAESFEKAIDALLKPRKQSQKKRRSKVKDGFDNSAREDARRTLTYRVRPLLPHATAVAALLRSKSYETDVATALNLLDKDVLIKDSYPYRDRPRYIATVCFPLLFKTADALDALTKVTASSISGWLVKSPIGHQPNMMYVAARLSRKAETSEAALSLGRTIAGEIAKETDTSAQINNYGSLARAIWPASTTEAKAYFKRGMEFADALGSDNYEKIVEFMTFAACYSGTPLPPTVVHSFATTCELNLPEESEKFAWVTYAQAMSRIAGAGALANVARLADRRKVDMSYSLPPLLTALAKDNHLAPDLAAALIGLDEPVETWSWLHSDFLEASLPALPSQYRETAFAFVLCEIDRQYRGSPHRESIQRVAVLADKYLPENSASRRQLANLRVEADVPSSSGGSDDAKSPVGTAEPPLPDAVLAGIDVTSSDAIDAVLQPKDSDEAVRRWPLRVLEALAQPIRGVEQRCEYMRAVSEAEAPTLIDKLTVLNDLASKWGEQSAAVADILPQLAQQLAARHASELIESDWDASYALRSLIAFSRQHGHKLIPIIITALRDRTALVPSTVWLKLATIVATAASASTIQSSIERFLTKSADGLPPQFGDGPWTAKFSLPETPPDVVAGLLWQRLGSPVAAERWRAAHALRRLVQIGRSEVLPFVVARAETINAGPFQDQSLPFFHLHAKLWLYISLARIAKDFPNCIKQFRDTLQSIAFNSSYPHVLLRHFASQTLISIADTLSHNDRDKVLKSLAQVNVSPFLRAKSDNTYSSFHQGRPSGNPKPKNSFHYDYDFSKYHLDGVARLFALPEWQIEDACTKWIRTWSQDTQNMYSCPRIKPHYRDGVGEWPAASIPSHDLWGGHLAWHALMLTVGELLPTTPVAGYPWDEDPWKEWISGQLLSSPDDLWLSDGTDPFPIDARRALKAEESSNQGVPRDPKVFAELIGLSPEFHLKDTLIVDGYWQTSDAINISVQSVIVGESDAMSVALAAALAEPFYRYIPDADNHGLINEQSLTAKLIRSWTTSPDISLLLDRHDPYSASTALSRPRPNEEFASKSCLSRDDPFARAWSLAGSGVFTAEAWGSRRGMGRHETERQGSRLSCRVEFLKKMLAAEKSQLVFLAKAEKYLEKHDRDGSGTFLTETLIGLLCPKRGIRVIRRIPRAARAAITALSKSDRSFFEPRLVALRKALSS